MHNFILYSYFIYQLKIPILIILKHLLEFFKLIKRIYKLKLNTIYFLQKCWRE